MNPPPGLYGLLYSNGDLLCSFCKYLYFANGFGFELMALPLNELFCLGGGTGVPYGCLKYAGGASTPVGCGVLFMLFAGAEYRVKEAVGGYEDVDE